MSILRFKRTRARRAMVAYALFCMIFLQIAVAAYACPVATPSLVSVPAMAGCADMAKPDPKAPALCVAHCQADQTATPDLNPLQVPPLALPPVHFALIEALLPQAQHYEDVPVCQSDPPPAQRFCSLQI